LKSDLDGFEHFRVSEAYHRRIAQLDSEPHSLPDKRQVIIEHRRATGAAIDDSYARLSEGVCCIEMDLARAQIRAELRIHACYTTGQGSESPETIRRSKVLKVLRWGLAETTVCGLLLGLLAGKESVPLVDVLVAAWDTPRTLSRPCR
jgi:hypothetical protein